MQSFLKFPDPGPETEAQKERRHYLGLLIKRRRAKRREARERLFGRITNLFR
ncbi:MAG: hypothetical protein AAF222_08895 [Pseudomonadota bacterium]